MHANHHQVVCPHRHGRRSAMSNSNRLASIVDADGLRYEWELRSAPQWGGSEGWKGMTVALLQKESQRGGLIELPPPQRL